MPVPLGAGQEGPARDRGSTASRSAPLPLGRLRGQPAIPATGPGGGGPSGPGGGWQGGSTGGRGKRDRCPGRAQLQPPCPPPAHTPSWPATRPPGHPPGQGHHGSRGQGAGEPGGPGGGRGGGARGSMVAQSPYPGEPPPDTPDQGSYYPLPMDPPGPPPWANTVRIPGGPPGGPLGINPQGAVPREGRGGSRLRAPPRGSHRSIPSGPSLGPRGPPAPAPFPDSPAGPRGWPRRGAWAGSQRTTATLLAAPQGGGP